MRIENAAMQFKRIDAVFARKPLRQRCAGRSGVQKAQCESGVLPRTRAFDVVSGGPVENGDRRGNLFPHPFRRCGNDLDRDHIRCQNDTLHPAAHHIDPIDSRRAESDPLVQNAFDEERLV